MPCPKSNAKLARDFVTCVLDNALTQYVSFPTPENNVLDLLLCKNLPSIPDVKLIAPVVKNAHDCIMMTLNMQYKSSFRKGNNECPKFNFRNANFVGLQNYYQSINWYLAFSHTISTNEL